MHFKGNAFHTLLLAPKDKDTTTQKTGVIYQLKCTKVGCEDEYIGESGRTFGDRLKNTSEHPPIYQQSQATGNLINMDCFSIVCRETHNISRTIKEDMFIHINNPSLNRNLGKYQLPQCGMRFYRTPHHSISCYPLPLLFSMGQPPMAHRGRWTQFSSYWYGPSPLGCQFTPVFPI